MTINLDCHARCSSFMHPLVSEVARFVLAGSSSGWFGLACPAHCSSSVTPPAPDRLRAYLHERGWIDRSR